MKYEIKYRESEVGDEIDERHRLKVLEYPGSCRICGRQARFMLLDYDDELSCSDECSNAFELLMTKRDAIYKMPRKLSRITPERCYVVFKERDKEGKRVRKYGWAVGTGRLLRFYVLFDDGTIEVTPLKRTAFTSIKPHININRFRER